ncbi:MAG: PHP domain-containing protein [Verrucomicrobiota bacterium]
MIKIDLHMHTGDDPFDGLPYTATQLIDKAVALEFAAIAITLHRKVFDDERVFDYARAKGLLLIQAVEWSFAGRDVLLFNIPPRDVDRLKTYADLRAYRRERGAELLVIAPHPFYPKGCCLGRELERNLDLFDAIEIAGMHFTWFDAFNNRARRFAAQHGKPLIANSDAHALWMFGQHFTRVDAAPTVPAIFASIRQGRVEPVSPPVTVAKSLRMLVFDRLLVRKKGRVIVSFPEA